MPAAGEQTEPSARSVLVGCWQRRMQFLVGVVAESKWPSGESRVRLTLRLQRYLVAEVAKVLNLPQASTLPLRGVQACLTANNESACRGHCTATLGTSKWVR